MEVLLSFVLLLFGFFVIAPVVLRMWLWALRGKK